MNEFLCAPIFSDHMVLQQKKPFVIFGHAKEGITLTATLFKDAEQISESTLLVTSKNLPTDKKVATYPVDGHISFCITMPPNNAGGPYTLSVSATDSESGSVLSKVSFFDVMFGEVYLAGGQSNMEYEIQNDRDYALVQNRKNKNVRFYQVGRRFYTDENFYEEEKKDHWMCVDDNFGTWSAVGYYFAEKLAEKLDVPVGIIGCNLGGTSASAWMDRDSLLSSPVTADYITEYDEIVAAQDPDTYEKERLEYLEYHAKWQPMSDEYYRTHPGATWNEMQAAVGVCKWPGPMGPKHEFRPCGLYETMLCRIMPYTLKGVLYYQGESDEHKPKSYYVLLKNLIAALRRDFGETTLPFLFVQLPVHKYRDNPATESWCIIRQAQMQVYKDVPHTGIAVCMELGEYNNIHPTSKAEVGRRLYLAALYKVYNLLTESEAMGPCYRNFSIENESLTLHFENVQEGFVVRSEDGSIPGFEICGEDQVFHPAKAILLGSTITLSSPAVESPTDARYLWVEYAPVPLYGTNGLPLAPFCTYPTFADSAQ